MLHLDRCHVEQHVALSHLMAEWRVTWAADGNALQIASRVRRRAAPSRRASACRESACRAVCACRARRWCAAAPATTDRNARAGPCRMLGPGAQRRPPVIVYTCFDKSSRYPYCTREPRRRAHCVILIYHDFSDRKAKGFFRAHDSRAPRGRGAARASGSCMVAWRPSRLASAVLVDAVARLTLRWSVSASTRRRARSRCRRGPWRPPSTPVP